MTVENKRKAIINVAYVAMIIFIGYLFFKHLFVVLLPFLIGLFVAASIQRPINFMKRRFKVPKPITAIVLVVLVLCAVSFITGQIVYQIAGEASELARYIATYIKDLPDQIENFKKTWPSIFSYFDGTIKTPQIIDGETIISKIQDILISFANGLVNTTANAVKAVPNMLVTFIITVVSCCFFSIDYDNIANFIKNQFSDKGKVIITNVKHTVFSSLFKIVYSYAIIMFITFCELSIGLSILRIDHSVAISSVIAIVDILPVLGVGTVLIPWIVVEIIIGNIPMAIGLTVLYAMITVIRNIIEPRIVGSQIGLHPIATLMSMYIGVKLLGGWGLILFPITLIILNTLQKDGEIHLWKTTPKDEEENSGKKKLDFLDKLKAKKALKDTERNNNE